MKNIPEKIYLQVGEDNTTGDFEELVFGETTWATERIFKTDLEYVLSKKQAQ